MEKETRPVGRASPEPSAHVSDSMSRNGANIIFILVNPQMGENIGAVARAMMNFGLRELRLVAPRDGWPNPAAEAMAAHGLPIIQTTQIYPTLREAIADLHYVYASTARDRRVMKPQVTPREAAAEAVQKTQQGQRIGLLFGPERSGLENEHIALAHSILTIPTDEKHSSLNIAQSAVVIAYELWEGVNALRGQQAEPALSDAPQRAQLQDVHGFFDQLEAALDKTYFFKIDEKKPHMWRNLRATFLRAALSEQEVHTLRGMVGALEKGQRK